MLRRLSPLFPYLRRYLRSFLLGGLALVAYNAAKAMIPLFIGGAIKDIQGNLSVAKVEYHALRLLAVAVVAAVSLYLTRQIIIGASREIEFDIPQRPLHPPRIAAAPISSSAIVLETSWRTPPTT